MDRADAKAIDDKGKGVIKGTARKQAELKFDKPLGSSHNDEADLRTLREGRPKNPTNSERPI